jgi:hypothetical protein
MADGPGYFRGRERCGADLIQQRLEQMVIALIDDRELDVGSEQTLRNRQAAEAGADDDHMMRHLLCS